MKNINNFFIIGLLLNLFSIGISSAFTSSDGDTVNLYYQDEVTGDYNGPTITIDGLTWQDCPENGREFTSEQKNIISGNYEKWPKKLKWEDAKEYCESYGMRLATNQERKTFYDAWIASDKTIVKYINYHMGSNMYRGATPEDGDEKTENTLASVAYANAPLNYKSWKYTKTWPVRCVKGEIEEGGKYIVVNGNKYKVSSSEEIDSNATGTPTKLIRNKVNIDGKDCRVMEFVSGDTNFPDIGKVWCRESGKWNVFTTNFEINGSNTTSTSNSSSTGNTSSTSSNSNNSSSGNTNIINNNVDIIGKTVTINGTSYDITKAEEISSTHYSTNPTNLIRNHLTINGKSCNIMEIISGNTNFPDAGKVWCYNGTKWEIYTTSFQINGSNTTSTSTSNTTTYINNSSTSNNDTSSDKENLYISHLKSVSTISNKLVFVSGIGLEGTKISIDSIGDFSINFDYNPNTTNYKNAGINWEGPSLNLRFTMNGQNCTIPTDNSGHSSVGKIWCKSNGTWNISNYNNYKIILPELISNSTSNTFVNGNKFINISKGWNLVSFDSDITKDKLYIGNCNITNTYGFDSIENKWIKNPASYSSNLGYWLIASADCQITYTTNNSRTLKNSIDLKSGWNLISFDKEIDKDKLNGCDIKNIYKYINVSNSWETPKILSPDEGYWFKVKSNCKLNY